VSRLWKVEQRLISEPSPKCTNRKAVGLHTPYCGLGTRII